MRLKSCWVICCLSALLLADSRAQDTVRVRLVFAGVPQSVFDSISSKVADTIAAVAGVPADYVATVGSTNAASSNASTKDSSTNNAHASTNPEKAVLESAPSQLPSPIATAPGYIRAQYYSSLSSSGSTTYSSDVESNVPKTTYTPYTTTANKVRMHRPNKTSTAASTSSRSSSSNSLMNSSAGGGSGELGTASHNTPVAPSSVSSPGSDRRLLAVESTTVDYAIKSNASAGPWAGAVVIRRKVMASAAGFGQASAAGFGNGFYATLEKNGVLYQPTVYLDGTQILAGGLSPDAPKSKFGARHENGPVYFNPSDLANKTSVVGLRTVRPADHPHAPAAEQPHPAPWVIGVVVAVVVLALAFGGAVVWRCRKHCPRGRLPDGASQNKSQNTAEQFITDNGGTGV